MGIAEDCGILLGDDDCDPADLISMIRAKESAQALLAEAIEREAAKVAATDGTPADAQPQRDPTSVVGAPSMAPQVGIRGEEDKDIGTSVAPLGSTKRKRKISIPVRRLGLTLGLPQLAKHGLHKLKRNESGGLEYEGVWPERSSNPASGFHQKRKARHYFPAGNYEARVYRPRVEEPSEW
jgi:hypothetical protein